MDSEDISKRAEEITNDPRMKEVIGKLQKLPLWFLGGAMLLSGVAYRYLPRNVITGGPKRMHLFGVGLFGGMFGLQIGVWRVKSFYWSVDPEGTLWREAEELVQEAKNNSRKVPTNHKSDNTDEPKEKEKEKQSEGLFKEGLFGDKK